MTPARSPARTPARPWSRDRRQEVLDLLRRHGPKAADDLVQMLPIGKCGLRHHLQAMEADGRLVSRLETAEELAARKRRKATPINARRRVVYGIPEAP